MRICVTGAAGFIGSHLCLDLLDEGLDVIGLDSFNDYYDPALKYARIDAFDHMVEPVDMKNFDELDQFFNKYQPDIVVHLGARAGVRDSVGKEVLYHQDNIDATQNLSYTMLVRFYMHLQVLSTVEHLFLKVVG